MATPLTQLGNVLLQGSANYANDRQARELEERRRAQQLADLQDARQFATQQQDYQRNLALMDQARLRDMAVDDQTRKILLDEGWLSPADARNEVAIQAAADARQAQLGVARTRQEALPQRLQGEADYLGQQDAELSAVESALNAKLSAPPPGPPSAAEVRQVAIRMTGKPVPSDAEIAAMIPAATEAITNERGSRWYTEKEDAKNQIQLLRSQRTALRQSLTGLLQQGFVPNRPPPAPAATLSMPSAALRPASAAEAVAAAGGRPTATAAPAPTASPSADYGGILGLLPDARTVGNVLSDPFGAVEIGGRAALERPARILNLIAGGDRRVAEGDAERAAGMDDAIRRFNTPSQSIPVNPFFQGNFMPPLPPLQPLPPARRSPALQFAPGY